MFTNIQTNKIMACLVILLLIIIGLMVIINEIVCVLHTKKSNKKVNYLHKCKRSKK